MKNRGPRSLHEHAARYLAGKLRDPISGNLITPTRPRGVLMKAPRFGEPGFEPRREPKVKETGLSDSHGNIIYRVVPLRNNGARRRAMLPRSVGIDHAAYIAHVPIYDLKFPGWPRGWSLAKERRSQHHA